MVGETEEHGGAPAWGGVDGDGPLVLLHYLPDDGQSQAGALATLLGGKEGLKDVGSTSGEMPEPVSETWKQRNSPPAGWPR